MYIIEITVNDTSLYYTGTEREDELASTAVSFTENIFNAKEFDDAPNLDEILKIFALRGLWFSDKFSHHIMEYAKSDGYRDIPNIDSMTFSEMDIALIRLLKTRVIEIQRSITEVSSKCI